jgi:hypothetical protein
LNQAVNGRVNAAEDEVPVGGKEVGDGDHDLCRRWQFATEAGEHAA